MSQASLVPKPTQHIADVLREGAADLQRHEIEVPQREAEHLLAAVLGCSRLHLFLDIEKNLSQEHLDQFWANIRRRAAHEPLQYITGQVEFCDMTLAISKGVFIPRPETELIIEAAKALFPPRRILDLCTGSGALAVALAKTFPLADVVGVDCADDALALASANAQNQGVAARTVFLKGDLFEAFKNNHTTAEKFDLIVSNPPYISESDSESLPIEVRDHEPAVALFAADEGRDFYRRILLEAPLFLNDQGLILFELGQGQSEWLRAYVEDTLNKTRHLWTLSFIKDWAEIDRIACLSRMPSAPKESVDG